MDPAITTTPTTGQPNGTAAGAPPAPQASAPAKEAVHEDEKSNSKGWEAAKQLKADLDAKTKELAELRGKAEAADKAEAEKKGEWQKLYGDEKTRRESLEKSLAISQKKSALSTAGLKLGLIDPDDIRLLDLDKLVVENGAVKGVDEALADLAKSKPHLFAKDRTSFATPRAIPGSGDGKTTFAVDLSRAPTPEQIRQMTPEQFSAWIKAKDAQNVDPLRR